MKRAPTAAAMATAFLMTSCTVDKPAEPPQSPTPAGIVAVTAGPLSGTVASALGSQIVVKVTSTGGVPMAGVTVSFSATGGSVSPAAPTTNAEGHAATAWTLGTAAGQQTLSAAVAGLTPVTFTATAAADVPAKVTVVAGDAQNGVAGGEVPVRPSVRVTDAHDNPNAGVQVTFSVAAGGGTLFGATQTTDSAGIARLEGWTLGSTGANALSISAAGVPTPASITATALSRATQQGVDALLRGLRMINYLPAQNAWWYMWDRWDPASIAADFASIRSMNFNAVRVVIHATSFEVPTPSDVMLGRLAQVVDMAHQAGLRTQLTLFDMMGNYAPWNYEATKRWADAVVGPYRDDPRIAYLDLQNEVNTLRPEVMEWMAELAPYVKSIAGDIPLTASVTSHGGLRQWQHIANLVEAGLPFDFYDAHYYGAGPDSRFFFRKLVEAAGGKALYIGELGHPTSPEDDHFGGLWGVPARATAREAIQEQYFRTVFHAASTTGIPAPAVWVYSDFHYDGIPPELAVIRESAGERSMGLVRLDGSEKPAAATLRALLSGVAPGTGINGGFEEHDGEGLPLYWRLWQNADLGFSATFARDTAARRSGSASARITAPVKSGAGVPAFYINPVVPPEPGRQHNVTAWARGLNVSGTVAAAIAFFDIDGQWLGSSQSSPLASGSSDWTQLTVSATAPAETAAVEIHLISDGGAASTVWFDDVTFSVAP